MTAALAVVVAALVNITGPGHYIHWGVIQISVGNIIVISLMVVTFLAAILIPYHRKGGRS